MVINNTKDLSKTGATILLYGESGVGKTTALGTLRGKTLLIDIEGGSTVLRGKDIDVVSIPSTLDGLKGVVDELTVGDVASAYDNIALDSATELQTFMLVAMGKDSKSGAPSLNDYGVVSFKMREYLRKFRNLRDKGVNVIVMALEMPIELEQGEDVVRTKMFPMVLKKLAPEACGLFDVVGRMRVSSKAGHEGQRYIVLDGNDDMTAKNRYDNAKVWLNADLGAFIADATASKPVGTTVNAESAGAAPTDPQEATTAEPTAARAKAKK